MSDDPTTPSRAGPDEQRGQLGVHMLAQHRGLGITPDMRLRFVTLLGRAADIAELHAPVPRWGWGVAPPYRP